MPEQIFIGSDLEKALDLLEDYTLDTHMLRCQNYHTVQDVLDSGGIVNSTVIKRLLAVCVHDLKEDMKYTVNVLNVISVILKKIKAEECSPSPDLLPSAMAIIHIVKGTASMNKVETLQILCIDTFLLYPEDILITVATSFCNEVLEVINLYSNQQISIELRAQPIKIISKLLKILPPDKRISFVKEGLSIWFSKVIPSIISNIRSSNSITSKSLEVLEALTEELLNIEYSKNPHWQCVLECIINPEKYRNLMKSLLEDGSDIWHRLWIVFIKLLKNQITMNYSKIGSPINSMLPVVETAFKMDIINRCRAFQCWNVLIDNFSTDTNEVFLNKRLKLLLIPLKSNNAKVEETVLAKLSTWWHLIRQFQSRMDKLANIILNPFLHFCFGKHDASDKSIFVPGLLSDNTKTQCIQAFVEIVGHVNCNGCTSSSYKLKEKLINGQLLVDYKNDWLFSLTIVMKNLMKDFNEVKKQQIKCTWKSFILTIAELPDNSVRKNLFDGLLEILPQLVKDYQCGDGFLNVFEILVKSLFDEEYQLIFKTKDEQNSPIHSIISVIIDPTLSNFYKSSPIEQSVTILKPITIYIVNELSLTSDQIIINILKDLSPNDSTLLLWTAFAESIIESKYEKFADNLCLMLLWPLKSLNLFTDVKYSSMVWLKMYNLLHAKLNNTSTNKDIFKILFNTEITSTNLYFILCALFAILKHEIESDDSSEIEKKSEFLINVVSKITDYHYVEVTGTFPLLIDILITILNKTIKDMNVILAKYVVPTVNHVLKLISQIFKEENENRNIIVSVENLFICIEKFFEIETFSNLKSVVVDNIIDCMQLPSLRQVIYPILKMFILTNKEDDLLFNTKVKNALETFDYITKNEVHNLNDNKLTTSEQKTDLKKKKKKEVSILNTVVENGEEYVVVKSNWKFNPKKLTEHQKEKLQRKREDIPALYQDLSQSQDNFKLITWKTDSQDASSTCSKSTSKSSDKDDISYLKTIPNSNFVPKIMENILSDNTKKDVADTTINKKINDTCDKTQPPSVVKTIKSHVTLKDRVFRNVRNLIEKSTVQSENKNNIGILNSAMPENICKTPLTKVKQSNNISNSAPSKITLDRPSRVKRKPKKFDDSEIFSIKKRRHSVNQNDIQSDNDIPGKDVQKTNTPRILSFTKDDNCTENNKPLIGELKTNTVDQEINTDLCPKVTEAELDDLGIKMTSDSISSKETENSSRESKKEDNIEEISDAINSNISINVRESDLIMEKIPNEAINISSSDVNEITTPKSRTKKEVDAQKSLSKKDTVKKSRIEKELAIDMVEGHPFLKTQSEKRLTRKCFTNTANRRRCLTEKFENSRLDSKNITKIEKKSKGTRDKSSKITKCLSSSLESNTQDKCSTSSEDLPLSEDIIESSQDSTLTTVSVKTSKSNFKKVPLVTLENIEDVEKCNKSVSETQDLIENSNTNIASINHKSKDIELPRNKTVIEENVQIENRDLTENMDTVPVDSENKDLTENMDIEPVYSENRDLTENMDTEPVDSEVIVIMDDDPPMPTDDTYITLDTQKVAMVDTEPIEINECTEDKIVDINNIEADNSNDLQTSNVDTISGNKEMNSNNDTQIDENSQLITVSKEKETNGVSSPLKNDDQRKKEFLNNTLEISPIKSLSPIKEKKSPPSETSNDYVIIKLSSPVQSNGEPFEKCDSPEIFTEDKTSPYKRNQSPPRQDVVVNNTSPSNSLSLKKNRPQVRSGGRAAQMLGLCVPDRIQTIISSERFVESEEPKRSSLLSTPARRNLRILYNSVLDDDNSDENEDSENFLKFKRSLPTADSSPSGPILKRKLSEIVDDTTVSPANKRKRVSFHDPPVSTTISVQKYIEPCGIRSPQNSALKRQERQLRMHSNLKSPRRLDTAFKLDSVLTKTVESFVETDTIIDCTDDIETISLDQTPSVETVKTCELNDSDPICPDLINCGDPIDNIAAELSSPAMKILLLKQLDGRIKTVADLAKMTELEIYRLCIKSPKVYTAKKVLTDYVKNINTKTKCKENLGNIEAMAIIDIEDEVEINRETVDTTQVQTIKIPPVTMHTQTDPVSTSYSSTQTEEIGNKSTEDIVSNCLLLRPDFVEILNKCLEEPLKQRIADELSFNAFIDLFMKKINTSNSGVILNKILDQQSGSSQNARSVQSELSFMQNYLCDRFDSKSLILFCSQLLQKIHDKAT